MQPLRCTDPSAAPMVWGFYRSADGLTSVTAEFVAMVRAAPADQALRQAEVHDLLSRAEQGQLAQPEDAKQIQLDRDLREIRFRFGKEHFRLYFAEPVEEPTLLLALHCHRKLTAGSRAAVKHDQDRHIQIAQRRFLLGRAHHWGLP